MPTLIKETPVLTWAALQAMRVSITLTPRSGLAVSDYGTVTVTVREDPLWPRAGSDKHALDLADPLADGWAVAASGTATASSSPISVTVTMPAGAGYRRYSVDVVATGGAAGRVQLVDPTFLTVGPTLKSA